MFHYVLVNCLKNLVHECVRLEHLELNDSMVSVRKMDKRLISL